MGVGLDTPKTKYVVVGKENVEIYIDQVDYVEAIAETRFLNG